MPKFYVAVEVIEREVLEYEEIEAENETQAILIAEELAAEETTLDYDEVTAYEVEEVKEKETIS